jgi:hypothetical protein
VAQPYARSARIPAPRPPDRRLDDFWVESPWLITAMGHNLSAYERNRVFLNGHGDTWFEISALTTADSEGDGRAVVAADLDGDGMEELIVRQSGGGPLLVFENRFPKAHWLDVSLRGTKSNSQGIGARLVATAGGRKIVRELFPANGFYSQGPAHAHFGLGESSTIDRLVITWPSGLVQELAGIAADRHVLVTEGKAEIEVRLK